MTLSTTTRGHERIKVGELTGWRWWRLVHRISANPDDTYFFLKSISANFWYKPQESIYKANYVDVYGFFSFKSIEDSKKFSIQLERPSILFGQTYVFGTIEMWGKVYEHEFGYRAEYCRITSLLDIVTQNQNIKILDELQKRYKC